MICGFGGWLCSRFSPNPENSPIHPSIILSFTFFRGDLRTSLTLDVGEDEPLALDNLRINVCMNPWNNLNMNPRSDLQK